MVFIEKETITNINNGLQGLRRYGYLEISTTGTEGSTNAKEYDNYWYRINSDIGSVQ